METTQPTSDILAAGGFSLPAWLVTALRIYIIAILPLALILVNARLLMTNTWVRWEYNRSYFPEDTFGMTQEERLTYGPLALNFLFNSEDISFLAEQTFDDGSPLYNERELSHMTDVKEFTGLVVKVGTGILGLLAVSIVALALQSATQSHLQRGLLRGGIVTIIVLVALVIFLAISFNALFTQFHQLFFQPGTWQFFFSDTLIRLFPERFWFDAFAMMFGGAIVQALIIGGAAWWWGRQLAG